MATNTNGHVLPAAYASPGTPYYASANGGLIENADIINPTLFAPVALNTTADGGLTVPAQLVVNGVDHPDADYIGAIGLRPGGIPGEAPNGSAGITIRAWEGVLPATAGTIVEVGTNTQGTNLLLIAGASGTGQVYDEVYNQPVSLQPITQVQTAPLLTPANPEEVLRGGQAAIAAAIATPGSQFNIFTVPRTGAYTIQTQIGLGNNVPTNSVVIPSTLVGGVPIWSSLSLGFQIQGTATAVPYASFEVIGGDFYGDQAFAGNSQLTKTYTSVAFLTAATNYAVVLNCAAGWNIGTAGQIKVELIAMC